MYKYAPLEYSNDIDEGIFECPEHGHTVYRPQQPEVEVPPRDDIILFNKNADKAELEAGLK